MIKIKKTFWYTKVLPGPAGIIPCGGGIMGIIGGPPIGGVGSMPGRGGPPKFQTIMSINATSDF